MKWIKLLVLFCGILILSCIQEDITKGKRDPMEALGLQFGISKKEVKQRLKEREIKDIDKQGINWKNAEKQKRKVRWCQFCTRH